MATTFHTLDKDLYNQEWFFEDYEQSQWASLSPKQSKRLFLVLDQDNAKQTDDSLEVEKLWSDEVRVQGDLFDGTDPVWQKIPLSDQQKDVIGDLIASTILFSQKQQDIVVGKCAVPAFKKVGGIEKRVWIMSDISDYNLANADNANMFRQDLDNNVYVLMLRVKPTGWQDGTICSHIVEIPANSYAARHLGKVFAADIDANRFLEYMNQCTETIPVA